MICFLDLLNGTTKLLTISLCILKTHEREARDEKDNRMDINVWNNQMILAATIKTTCITLPFNFPKNKYAN